MQAGYVFVANKQALAYLPSDADINALDYDQLAAWTRDLRRNTGNRLLGFPAGPQGPQGTALTSNSLGYRIAEVGGPRNDGLPQLFDYG